MVAAALIILMGADLFLIVAFLRLQRRQLANQEVVKELTEERSMLNDLRLQIRNELQVAHSQAKAIKDQVQVLATEAEQEVRQGISDITGEVDAIISTISQKLDAPLKALSEKQHFIVQMTKEARRERELLSRTVARSENVAKLLKSGDSWEEIVDQLEVRRYSDIRAMLAKGVQPHIIARDLGVSEHEVKLISGT